MNVTKTWNGMENRIANRMTQFCHFTNVALYTNTNNANNDLIHHLQPYSKRLVLHHVLYKLAFTFSIESHPL